MGWSLMVTWLSFLDVFSLRLGPSHNTIHTIETEMAMGSERTTLLLYATSRSDGGRLGCSLHSPLAQVRPVGAGTLVAAVVVAVNVVGAFHCFHLHRCIRVSTVVGRL